VSKEEKMKQHWLINGFRLFCDRCGSYKFFVYMTKGEDNDTYICAECSNIINKAEDFTIEFEEKEGPKHG
jgi:hypothetical protein